MVLVNFAEIGSWKGLFIKRTQQYKHAEKVQKAIKYVEIFTKEELMLKYYL